MRRGIVGALAGSCVLVVCLIAPSATLGAGAPVAGVVAWNGVANADSRYETLEAGKGTVLVRISRDSGEIVRDRYVDERLAIPAVASDGSGGGLSADGETLVLTQPNLRLRRPTTRLAIFDTQNLAPLDRIKLDGAVSFDAISPDGERLYFINYLSRRDPTEYEVRTYDVDSSRLLRQPIVDPEESGDQMYGWAVTRATSPDGRWAYTLYQGRDEDFIHALDTERGRAVCIDLDELEGKVWRLDMNSAAHGQTLELTQDGQREAVVDTQTFEVSYPGDAAATEAPAQGNDDGEAWILGAVVGGIAVLLTGLLVRRRRAAAAT
jgi:hypothetical protein